ncbi:MAG TPA: T9SS type A sorting domain-containing protein [Bacteroidales bacterium]|nr:T9SS type A sorting domain-containing protein [Bacteroidales bacterium]
MKNPVLIISSFILAILCSSTLTLYAQLDPPENLQANVTDNNVHLTWNAPGGGGVQEELIYDNNTVTGAYKYPGVSMSTHMSPAEPCQILTLRYYTTVEGSNNQFNAKIFNWNNTQPGTTVLYNSTQLAANGEWVEVDVSGENLNVNGDFVVGFGSFTEDAYLGYDKNLNNGRSWDYFESQQIWMTYDEAYLIRAVVLYPSGKIETLAGKIPETKNLISKVSERSSKLTPKRIARPIVNQAMKLSGLTGYNIYRDNELLNITPVASTTYDDLALALGTYSYTVTAVYDEGESEPAGPVEVTISDTPLPGPSNLGGVVDGDRVNLWWISPGGGSEEELIYDNSEYTGSYKYPGFTMSTRMSPAAECELIKLKYYTTLEGSDAQFYARVFGWNGSQPGTAMKFNRSEEASSGAWVEVDVEGEGLYFTGDFVVGFGSVSEEAFLAYDADLNNGRSWDFEESSQTWTDFNETYLIRAVVRYGDGTYAELGGGNSKDFLGYNLYRNEIKINNNLIETTNYTDTFPGYGVYNYNVSAVYDEGESSWSETATFSYNLGIRELVDIGVTFYPNPASEWIVINSASAVGSIEIISLAGALLYSSEYRSPYQVIYLRDIASGIYLLKVETTGGTGSSMIIIR